MLNRFLCFVIKWSIELDAERLDEAGQVVGIEPGSAQLVLCGIDDPIGRAPEVGFPQVGAVEDDIAQPAIGPRSLSRIGLEEVAAAEVTRFELDALEVHFSPVAHGGSAVHEREVEDKGVKGGPPEGGQGAVLEANSVKSCAR